MGPFPFGSRDVMRGIEVGCEDLDLTNVRHVQETASDGFADKEVALDEVQRMAVQEIGMEVTLNNGKPRQDREPRAECGTVEPFTVLEATLLGTVPDDEEVVVDPEFLEGDDMEGVGGMRIEG